MDTAAEGGSGTDASGIIDMDGGGDTSPVDSGSAVATIEKGAVQLSPDNTRIEFVGTHVGDEPNPRTGGFREFAGQAEVDGTTLKSLSITIQTNSLWTEVGGNLTNHLNNEDFFDTRQYPTAKFQSTQIEVINEATGEYSITGNLTLLATTKPLTFPATAKVTDGELSLNCKFTFDRTEWGMNRLLDRVEEEVSLAASIGAKNDPREGQGGFGGGRGGRGGGARGGFDPAARFKQQDTNQDDKLSKEEMPERIRERFETFDADSDGGVTLEEFQQGFRQLFQSRGGGRGRGDGQSRPQRPQRPDGQ